MDEEGLEYDPYEEGLVDGKWIERNGRSISVEKMSDRHVRNSKYMCEQLSKSATFSCESDKWDTWVGIFSDELDRRSRATKEVKEVKKKSTPRGSSKKMRCHCGCTYTARVADIKRGWGLSCSKRCAAIRRDFGRPKAVEI